MSEFKVCLTTIVDVRPHDNADRLEIASVYGFQVVIKKDSYKVGDKCFYIPIDSVIPQDLEDYLFPEDSKIKLTHHRVKQIRIRSFPSQGMLVSIEDMTRANKNRKLWGSVLREEMDYAEILGITKYEPPTPNYQNGTNATKVKAYTNSNFGKYNGIDNIKWNPNAFKGTQVVIQEKLHGSNCRAGKVPTEANTVWKKIKKIFGLLEKYEYVYGSNNVELTNRDGNKNFYGADIYKAVLEKVGARDKLKDGEIIYGELIGEGVQKNYSYGHKTHHFVLFDVKKYCETDKCFKWLDPEQVIIFASLRGFDVVPFLYIGEFSQEKIEELVSGPSVYDPYTKVREGIVVKARVDYHNTNYPASKKVFKHINPAYLDKEQSDFH